MHRTRGIASPGSRALVAALLVAVGLSVAGTSAASPSNGLPESPSASPWSSPVAPKDLAVLQPMTTDQLLALHPDDAPVRPPVTIVAQATIDLDTRASGPPCRGSGAPCPIGTVVTSDGSAPVIVADRAVRELYQRAHTVDGVVGFELHGDQLRFLGHVAMSADGSLVQAAGPETMAWADAINAGELIAVDGWLTVLGWGVPCPAPSPEVVGDVDPFDSPFARCPAGWIAADATLPQQEPGSVTMTPPGFAIPVQASAYEDYAPDPGRAEDFVLPPRRGVYLLRHVGVNGGPPKGWQVVGRLDQDPTQAVSASASPMVSQGAATTASPGAVTTPIAHSTDPDTVLLRLAQTPGPPGPPPRHTMYFRLDGDGVVRYRPLAYGVLAPSSPVHRLRLGEAEVQELLAFALGPADVADTADLYSFLSFGPGNSTLIEFHAGGIDRSIEYQSPPANLVQDPDPGVAGLRLLVGHLIDWIESQKANLPAPTPSASPS